MECCATNNYTDYSRSTSWTTKNYTIPTSGGGSKTVVAVVPISCCKVDDPSKFPDKMDEMKFTDLEGCLTNPTSTTVNEQVRH